MIHLETLVKQQIMQTSLLQQVVEQLQNLNIKMDGLINITHNQHQEKREDVPTPTSSVRPSNASQPDPQPHNPNIYHFNINPDLNPNVRAPVTDAVDEIKEETFDVLRAIKDPEMKAKVKAAVEEIKQHRAHERGNRPDVPLQKHRDFNTGVVEDDGMVTWGDIAKKQADTAQRFLGMEVVYKDQVNPYQMHIVNPDSTVITTIHLPQEIDALSTRVVVSSAHALAQKQKS